MHLQDFVDHIDSFDQLNRQLVLGFHFLGRLQQELEHFGYFLSDEGDRPLEEIHEVGQEVGVWVFQELLDVQGVIL